MISDVLREQVEQRIGEPLAGTPFLVRNGALTEIHDYFYPEDGRRFEATIEDGYDTEEGAALRLRQLICTNCVMGRVEGEDCELCSSVDLSQTCERKPLHM